LHALAQAVTRVLQAVTERNHSQHEATPTYQGWQHPFPNTRHGITRVHKAYAASTFHHFMSERKKCREQWGILSYTTAVCLIFGPGSCTRGPLWVQGSELVWVHYNAASFIQTYLYFCSLNKLLTCSPSNGEH
jgi:hypothetical protein